MIRHLDNARLDLRQALEQHKGCCELDGLTRLILEAVRAITAALRKVLAVTGGNSAKDATTSRRHLEIVP
jgi:hypothetical protein